MTKEDLILKIQKLQKKTTRLEKTKLADNTKKSFYKSFKEQFKIFESNLDALINNSSDTIWLLDKNLNFVYFNELFKNNYKEAFNINLKKGINAIKILSPELRDFWLPKYSAALKGDKIQFEFSASLSDEVKYFYVSLNPIFFDNKISGISALSTDITEHKLKDMALVENQFKLQNIVSSSPIILFMIDKKGIFTLSEGKGLDALGLRPGEVVGRSAIDMYKDYPLVVSSIKQALKGEISSAVHEIGNLIFDVNYAPVKSSSGEIQGVIGVANDITLRWKAEKESSRLSKVIDESLNEIYLFNAGTLKFDYVNEGALKNLGYSAEQLKSLTPLDIKPDFTYETFKALIDPLLKKEKKKIIFETRHKRSDGSTYPAEIHLHLVGLADKPQFLAIINDITDRKKAESELVKKQGLISATLLSIGEALISTDNEGNITMMNPVAENLTGWKLAECTGRNINEIFNIVNAKSGDKAHNPIERTLKEGVIVGLANHTKLISKDGTEYQIADSCAPIKDYYGRILGAVLVFRNVTKEYERREKLIISDQAIKNSINGVALADLSGKLNFVNSSFLKMWGYADESQVLGRGAQEFWLNPEEAGAVIQKIFENGFYTTELKAQKADGSLFDVFLAANLISDPDGNLLALFGSFVDITVSKRTKDDLVKRTQELSALLRSNQKLSATLNLDQVLQATTDNIVDLMDLQSAAIYLLDGDWLYLGATSPALPKDFPENLRKALLVDHPHINKTINRIQPVFIPDSLKAAFTTAERAVVEQQGLRSILYIPLVVDAVVSGVLIVAKTGEPKFLTAQEIDLCQALASIASVAIENSKLFQKAQKEISSRKNTEDALRISEERYRILSQNTSDFTFACSRTENGYKINWLAGATLILTGYTKEEILEKGCWGFLVHKEDEVIFKNNVLELTSGKQSECELRIISKNEVLKWMRVNTTCLHIEEKDNDVVFGSCSDITAQKIAEESLRTSEQKYRMLFESNPHPMWVYDLETLSFLTVNETALAKYGYSKDEFLNMTIKQIHPDDEIDKLIQNVKNVTEGLDNAGLWKHIKKDGSIIFVEIVSHTLYYENRRSEMVLAIDVTERIIAEQSLKESQARLSLALASTNQGIYDLNVQTGEAFVTPEYATMLGYDPESFKETNDNWIKRLHPDDRDITAKAYIDYINGKTSEYRVEFRQRTADNQWKWILSLGKTVEYDENGKPLRMLGTHTDITIQKNAEIDLIRLSRAVEQSPVSIVVTDVQGRIEYVNPKFEEISGYSFNEVIGQNPRILSAGSKSKLEYEDLWKTILAGNEWQGEFLNKKKNGDLYWESAFISPILDHNGKILNFLAVKEDITEKKKLLADLIEAKQKAEEMNKIKSYFFANMSHELRTPFVGIMGFSELLSESLKNPEEKNMAQQILKSSKRLTDTLNKILNVTRLEFDKLEIKPVNFDICKLINDIVILYSNSAQIKNTSLRAFYSEKSIIVNTDSKLLEDVLNNLVSNAIKFTDNGTITLSVDTLEDEQKNYLVLKVSDTGIGIPKEKQGMVWQEFRQVSEGLNRSFEGTGLGLTISKKYIETLGGFINLESQPGVGTTFTIRLPLDSKTSNNAIKGDLPVGYVNEVKEKNPKIKLKPKVLFVEDEVISLQYVSIILKSICDVDTAINAENALLLAEKNKYDILMLDINLGRGIDGIELLKRIKDIPGYQTTKAIAVTAYAAESDKNEFLEKGFTHYISKPFSSKELKDLITQTQV